MTTAPKSTTVFAVAVSVFFIRFSGLLQGIKLLLKLDYVRSISFVGFPVLPEFIGSLDGFSSPVVTAAYQF